MGAHQEESRSQAAVQKWVARATAKTWKLPKRPSTEEQIKKMWCICTMEYYLAVKKNTVMPLAATWMDLEMVVLSEAKQTGKDRYPMCSFFLGL